MNTQKKKHKNRPNKPQNPNPPQNVDISEKVDNVSGFDKIEDPVKTEERVPEILSKIADSPAEDTKENDENASPKKPKRNRGKKKKCDKTESVDITEKKASGSEITEGNKLSDDVKNEEQKSQEMAKSDDSYVPVAPTSRKKKSKNKGQDNVDINLEVEVKSNITETSPNEAKIEIPKDNILVTSAQEQECKSSKKKNKKNKKIRNETEIAEDSFDTKDFQTKYQETDDGTVLVQSCMEELLDEPLDSKDTDTKLNDIPMQTKEAPRSKNKNKKGIKMPLQDVEVLEDQLTPTQLFNISEGAKPMTFLMELPEEKDDIIEIREEDSDIVIANADVIDNTTVSLAQEHSFQPKAKIAKPVEKKGKDKKPEAATKHQELALGEKVSKDNASENKSKITEEDDNDDFIMSPITDDSPEDVLIEGISNKNEEKISKEQLTERTQAKKVSSPDVVQTKQEKVVHKIEPEIIEKKEDENVKPDDTVVLSSTGVRKKEKDSKKGKQPISEVEKQDEVEHKKEEKKSDVSLALILNTPKKSDTTNLMPSEEANLVSIDSNTVLGSVDGIRAKKEPKVIPMPYFAIDQPVAITESEKSNPRKLVSETIMSSETTSDSKKSYDTNKKRKKSPKPTKKPDFDSKDDKKDNTMKSEQNEELICSALDIGKTIPSGIKLSNVDEMEMALKFTSSDNTNVAHIQATAQTPTDITPDMVETPRSSSADIIDDNNNTMVREIMLSSTLASPMIVPETPIISYSGDLPKAMSHVIALKEVKDVVIPVEVVEKTDLKSKMMEVNQDMEGLRLSIEKSLAELTALEKKDDEFGIKICENKFTDSGPKKDSLHTLTPIQETDIQFKLPIDFDRAPRSADQIICKSDLSKESMEYIKDLSKPEELTSTKPLGVASLDTEAPVCPSRKDNKGKNKSKKKDRQTTPQTTSSSDTTAPTARSEEVGPKSKDEKTENKEENQSQQAKGKQQSTRISSEQEKSTEASNNTNRQFDPIENFEDAMTSSADDVNKSFEIIANEASNEIVTEEQISEPLIDVMESENVDKDKENKSDKDKVKPIVSQPKNLLGHPAIPVRSSKMDYKKEKNKTPNLKQAKVKIKDANELEKSRASKESQTENKPKLTYNKVMHESVTCVTSENDEYIYKYSFRKVFLSSNCHVCKKDLKEKRVTCSACNLLFYCSETHKDEDFPQHQAFCFAVSTISELKGQKHIYEETRGVSGQAYRLLRMQHIVSCERTLKRKLLPSEQEALLYPRLCADGSCREWRNRLLLDCPGCGQISYCSANPEHLPKTHGRWCRSYALYQKLVVHQLTQGRLEPRLPTKVLSYERISDNINRLLADMYDEKIDMNDIQYAALTQLATAPLTAAYGYQLYSDKMKSIQANGFHKKPSFVIHVVGAELQFEADSLNKWEVFFLHLRPDLLELRITLVGPELNPSNLPLELLGKIKLCPSCRVDRRRVVFQFQDKLMYHQYRDSDDFVHPDLVCAFNPSIHRSASYSHSSWTPMLSSIFKLKTPFCITSYSMTELQRDLIYIKDNSQVDFNTVSEAKFNPFASVRPDRNFITDDEIPLLFKNYCYSVLIGAL